MSPKLLLILAGVLLLGMVAAGVLFHPESEWEGVDAAVVEKHAGALGREASPPLIDLRGDAQLFVFAVAGALGGFVAGYCWRELFPSKPIKEPIIDAPSH